tara:strand:+ start:7176 stop:8180 length:1005 start_codon:yes stop_codon:yes gene_type:complete
MSGTVAKPKIYIDYISYARAIGKPVTNLGSQGFTGTIDFTYLFTLNPHKTTTLNSTPGTHNLNLAINEEAHGGASDPQLDYLFENANYWAILGNNFDDLGASPLLRGRSYTGSVGSSISASQIDFETYNHDNIRFFSFDGLPNGYASGIQLKFTGLGYGDNLRLGSFSMGRSFSFPHNANLSMNIKYDQTGIKKKKTAGGRDIVDVQYYKSPDWDNRRAWDFSEFDNRTTGYVGRRSWDLTFSFLTKDDTFPVNMNEDYMFDQPTDGSTAVTHSTENITSHFMGLTLNGQLPFIFQPDDTKAAMALCRLKSNSFSVQQSAPNLYTCKMSFEETW